MMNTELKPTVKRRKPEDKIIAGETYRVLYNLPAVENDRPRYGDGMDEVLKYDYHNKYKLICVAPEFTSKPWYCDHSSDMGRFLIAYKKS